MTKDDERLQRLVAVVRAALYGHYGTYCTEFMDDELAALQPGDLGEGWPVPSEANAEAIYRENGVWKRFEEPS